jgi:SNF2 family DNA or RNA helicase
MTLPLPLCTPEPLVQWSGLELGVASLAHATFGPFEHAARALWACELASAAKFDDLLCLPTLEGVVAHGYQLDTVRKVMRLFRGRALLADEVGLGKTVEALIVLREYQLRRLVRRALILVPPSLVNHWQAELGSKFGIVARIAGKRELADDPEAFWNSDGIIVASLALARGETQSKRVASTEWDLVVVDEAHHVKNRNTASFKLVNSLKTRFLLLLTATPIETDLEEIYNLVTLLRPGQFATPAQFRKRFVNSADPTSPKDRQQLRSLLSEVMVRNTRAGSGLALPPRFVSTVIVDPEPNEAEMYQAVVQLLREHSGERGARLVAATLLLQAGSSAAALLGTLQHVALGDKHSEGFRTACARAAALSRSLGPSRKTKALVEIISGHRQQALVFTRYRRTLDEIADQLARANIYHVCFHGGLDVAHKQAALDEFQLGAPVLLATEIGGEGQNLQFCSLLVNYDLPWNPMQIEQRIGRLHRMGQKSEVRVFNLCANGTAEERVLDVLDRRLHLFELVVGEMDMVLGNLADERDLEERILDLYAQSQTNQQLDQGFDAIADELSRARSVYERTRAFDAALFQDDYES